MQARKNEDPDKTERHRLGLCCFLVFRSYWISNAIDRSEDDLIWQEVPKEAVTDINKQEDEDLDPFAVIDQLDSFSDSREWTV